MEVFGVGSGSSRTRSTRYSNERSSPSRLRSRLALSKLDLSAALTAYLPRGIGHSKHTRPQAFTTTPRATFPDEYDGTRLMAHRKLPQYPWTRPEIPLDTVTFDSRMHPQEASWGGFCKALPRLSHAPSYVSPNLHSTFGQIHPLSSHSPRQVPHLHHTFSREYLRAKVHADSFQPQLTLDTIQPW